MGVTGPVGPDWGKALSKLQASKAAGGATSAVIHFVPGTDEAKAKKWLAEAVKRGIITNYDCQNYDDKYGKPVFYIP